MGEEHVVKRLPRLKFIKSKGVYELFCNRKGCAYGMSFPRGNVGTAFYDQEGRFFPMGRDEQVMYDTMAGHIARHQVQEKGLPVALEKLQEHKNYETNLRKYMLKMNKRRLFR